MTRVRLLLRELARQPKHTLASVLAAENAGATGDPRTFLWPTVSAVLASGRRRARSPPRWSTSSTAGPPTTAAGSTPTATGRWTAPARP